MSTRRIGIILHGVTGRMGMNQHLVRSILEIRRQGGVALADGTRLVPDPLLVGRNAAKVEALARQHGVQRWTADLDAALASTEDEVFFDAASTPVMRRLVAQGMDVGSHSVAHSRVFSAFPMGDGRERYPRYRPFVEARERARGGTILGELRVSKFLLEQTAGANVVCITGPSRTADIEHTLSRGVHGPGEVHVVFVG